MLPSVAAHGLGSRAVLHQHAGVQGWRPLRCDRCKCILLSATARAAAAHYCVFTALPPPRRAPVQAEWPGKFLLAAAMGFMVNSLAYIVIQAGGGCIPSLHWFAFVRYCGAGAPF